MQGVKYCMYHRSSASVIMIEWLNKIFDKESIHGLGGIKRLSKAQYEVKTQNTPNLIDQEPEEIFNKDGSLKISFPIQTSGIINSAMLQIKNAFDKQYYDSDNASLEDELMGDCIEY